MANRCQLGGKQAFHWQKHKVQHTIISRLKISDADGTNNTKIEVMWSRPIRVRAGTSKTFREKNMNVFEGLNGKMFLEYTIEPHLVCELLGTRSNPPPEAVECLPVARSSSPMLAFLAKNSVREKAGAMLSGSAGFVTLQWKGKQMLMGIGHLRHVLGYDDCGPDGCSTQRLLYSHFFYAFENTPPFDIQYATPDFCLPGDSNRLVYPLQCPRTGLIQTANGIAQFNVTHLIITFDEHDCEPRYMHIAKEAILSQFVPLDSNHSFTRHRSHRRTPDGASVVWTQ